MINNWNSSEQKQFSIQKAARVDGKTIFELLGGRPIIEKVHKIFYDKIYEHPWIGKFFKEIDQEHIENQQTDFITVVFGGPKNYSGAFPIPAHKRMLITEELYDLRHQMLRDSIKEAGVPESIGEHWLKVDLAFKSALIKKSVSECEKRFATDDLLIFRNPANQKA